MFQSYRCRDRPAVVCPDQVGRSRYRAQDAARRAVAMAVRTTVGMYVPSLDDKLGRYMRVSLAGRAWPG